VKRFSSVLVVDSRGWLLLQERDEHPVIDPERWGFVGGGVEDGEDHEQAAYRELAEETGLDLAGRLEWFDAFEVFHEATGTKDVVHLFATAADLRDEDIVVGEGRRIVFVSPDSLGALDLTAAARVALPAFLASDLYRRLAP